MTIGPVFIRGGQTGGGCNFAQQWRGAAAGILAAAARREEAGQQERPVAEWKSSPRFSRPFRDFSQSSRHPHFLVV